MLHRGSAPGICFGLYLAHVTREGGVLEDPAQAPPADLFMLTTSPELAPNEPENVTIGFNEGTPVAVNGTFLDPVAIVASLNEIGGRHGIGRIDIVEDRLVGMKSRGVYETPGGRCFTPRTASWSSWFWTAALWPRKTWSLRITPTSSMKVAGGRRSARRTTPSSLSRRS